MAKLFVDEPLSQKIDSGIGEFYANVLRQKEYAKKAATETDKDGNRPPEVRLGRISSSGRVKLEFTNSMSFPSLEDLIELNKQSKNKLIELFMLKGDEETIDTNLKGWDIVSVSSKLIEIDLTFDQPLQVSQGSESDKLIVQVGLSEYPDEN